MCKHHSPGSLATRPPVSSTLQSSLEHAAELVNPCLLVPDKGVLGPSVLLTSTHAPVHIVLPGLGCLKHIFREHLAHKPRNLNALPDVLLKPLDVLDPRLASGIKSILRPVVRLIITLPVLALASVNRLLLAEVCLDLYNLPKPTHVFFPKQPRIL